jgi:predicted MFS family arabinose efflux permease
VRLFASMFGAWRGLRDLPRPIWLLSIATLINRAGTMALPFLALYLTERLRFSEARAGFVVTCYGTGALITSVFAGRVSDVVGPLLIMRVSLIGSGIVVACFPFAHGYVAIVCLALLWSFVGEAYRAPNSAVLALLAPKGARKTTMSLNRLAINLGMSVGPAVGGLLAAVSYPILFFVDAATSAAAGFFLIVMLPIPDTRRALESDHHEHRTHARTGWRLAVFLTALALIAIIFFQHLTSLPLFLVRNLHFSPAVFGMVIPINTLLIVLLEIPLNRSMEHWRHDRALAVGALLLAVGFGMLAFATGILVVIASVVVWTFGEMILMPCSVVALAEMAPAGETGKYMGYLQTTFAVGFMAGPWLGSTILEHLGPAPLWSSSFVIGAVAALMLWSGSHRQ